MAGSNLLQHQRTDELVEGRIAHRFLHCAETRQESEPAGKGM